ncbi:MAG: hypothetical protein QG656_259, partial [Candidatus Hydrogenedentes bacterium]|nr:hypothetical protein [Candidatus Hydrogenedentota bacterium]
GAISNFDLGGFIERPDWLSSVAFWYQYPPATFTEPLPPADKRIAPYRVIDPTTLKYRADPPLIVMPTELGLAYIPNSPKASFELDFEVAEPGRYNITGIFMYGIVAGVYQPFLDGKMIGGPIDFVMVNYSPGFTSLDTHELEAGTHTLRFESVPDYNPPAARIPGPKFYGLNVVRLLLLRLDDMAGYLEISRELLKKK